MTEPWEGAPDVASRVAFLTAIVDNLAHPVFVKDREFRFVVLNRALCEMVGYEREQMLGKTDYDFFPKEQADFFREKDIEMFSTEGTIAIDEEPITDSDGAIHVLATTKVPLRNDAGEVTHVVGIIHDITRLKAAEGELRRSRDELEQRVAERTAELQTAQQQLLRRERLAVLGQLAGGVAHQIRNPLGAISNAAAVLRRVPGVRSDGNASRAAEIIAEEVGRANRIITELLDYARVRPPTRARVPVTRLVEHAMRQQEAPDGIETETALDSTAVVWVDEDQVRDALGNVLHNAYEAVGESGRVKVDCALDDSTAIVAVVDDGPGVDPKHRERLFEPLITTKPYGLGLGLTTARALVENSGGQLVHRDGHAGGARFELLLPLAGADRDGEQTSR